MIVLVYHIHSRYKKNEEEKKVARVSFKVPPPRMDICSITTQTKYPQEDYDEVEYFYLDPEIYR